MDIDAVIDEELRRLHEKNELTDASPQQSEFDLDLSPFNSPEKSSNFANNLNQLTESIAEGFSDSNFVNLEPGEVDDLLGLSEFDRNSPNHSFRGGILLDNKAQWTEALNLVERAGGHVPNFTRSAVERGSADLFDKTYFKDQKFFKFNGKSYTKKDLEGKIFKNYAGATEFEAKLSAELKTLCKVGVAKEVSAGQVALDKATISPLNFLWDEQKGKGRMIYHWCYWFGDVNLLIYIKNSIFLASSTWLKFPFPFEIIRATQNQGSS